MPGNSASGVGMVFLLRGIFRLEYFRNTWPAGQRLQHHRICKGWLASQGPLGLMPIGQTKADICRSELE
ncbi:hypothetical protein C4E44_31380 [Pseudomonas sp. MWU12-2312b]|nr:hypothetical protein C4E44_31380 [Pseudomonas sp. MWU12-2312b]